MTRRLGPEALAASGVAAFLIAVVLLVAAFGTIGLAVAAAAVATPVVVLRPAAALALVVAVQVGNLGGAPGLAGAMGLAVVSIVVGLNRGTVRLVWSPVFLWTAILLSGLAISVLWARESSPGLVPVLRLCRDLAYLWIVTTLLVSAGAAAKTAKLAVAVAAVLAGLTAFQEFVLHNSTTFGGLSQVLDPVAGGATVRHAGPMPDANLWGRSLVIFLPLALALWACQPRGRGRWFLIAAAAVLMGVYLTQSRGALLAVAATAVAWVVMAGRQYARKLLAPALVLGLILAPGAASRLATLGQLREPLAEQSDASLMARYQVLKIGVRVFLAHPVTGVGAGNFLEAEQEYIRRSGFVWAFELGTHNVYLQWAVEEGVIGFLAWVLFLFGGASVGWRAMRNGRQWSHDPATSEMTLLSVGVLAGLFGWASASVFLDLSFLQYVMLLMALAISLDVEVRGRMALGGSGPPAGGAEAVAAR